MLAEATTSTGVAVAPQAADTQIVAQIGQPSSDMPEAIVATPAAQPAVQPVEAATVQANQLFAVLAEATAVTPASNPTAAATKTDVATAAKVKLAKPSEGTDDASAAVTVDPAAVVIAATVPVAVVIPAPVVAFAAADPAVASPSIKPVEGTPTPAVPAPTAPATPAAVTGPATPSATAPASDIPAAEVAAAAAAGQPIAPTVSQPDPGTQAITPAAPQAITSAAAANLSAALQLKPDTLATPPAAAELETNADVASPVTAPDAKVVAAAAIVSEKPAGAETAVETSLKAAVSVPPESVAPKAQPQAESKPGAAVKAKTEIKIDQHGRIVRAAADSRADAAPAVPSPANDTPAGPQIKPDGIGPARSHSSEPDATPIRVAATGTHDTALAAPQSASTPTPSFNLIAPALAVPVIGPITALRVDTNSPAVPVDGLAVEIVSRAQDGLRRFEIRLDPPELGRIDVRLDVDEGGKVTSHLRVERSDTLDLLRRDAPQLERALQQAGLNTDGGLQFSLRDRSFAHRDQTPGDGANTTRLIIPEDDSIAADAARRGYGRLVGLGGGVDIRI